MNLPSAPNRPELRYLLALLYHTRLLAAGGAPWLATISNVAELFTMPKAMLRALGLPEVAVKQLAKINWELIDAALDWGQQPNQYIITIYDGCYPELLREIVDPPVVLFVAGNLALLNRAQVAMVGSRNPTPWGGELAYSFARDLAQVGLVITSGLAAGIDAASHRGALENAGPTIAVMGTGLAQVYPRFHQELASTILARAGAWVSEFPLHAPARSWHFPRRNRIISGLCLGTLVVEAALRSGSLITARLAAEQGREVFAIPGALKNPQAQGCNQLIQQGAKLVQQLADILEELPGLPQELLRPAPTSLQPAGQNKLDREHQKLLDCMGFEVTTGDDLTRRTGLAPEVLTARLLELELLGYLKVVAPGYMRIK